MLIRALLLMSVVLLPVSLCHAVVQNGGFETGSTPWRWAVNLNGFAGVSDHWDLRLVGGGNSGAELLPNEGDQFFGMMPDGGATGPRPQIVSLFQEDVAFGTWEGFAGSYAFDQLYPGQDYLRISVVQKSVWDPYISGLGGFYDGLLPDASTAWYQTFTADTCVGPTFQANWWQDFASPMLKAGSYTVLFDTYRYGANNGYSVAGIDSISHTPEPSLGLLLLVGMVPLAIGFKRRRRA